VLFRLAADALVVLHLAFIMFVVAGGFLTWRWRRLVWIHIPVALYGAAIEFVGWICPLTPWEIALRRQAGLAGYEGGFIEHYVLPIIYPGELTPTLRLVLGMAVVAANAVAYTGFVLRRRRTC
jgi:uncharacterized membrane protein YhhN